MYKLLLSWRYLKTRYIALASIISVTLGVATLIVVNSVMAGFTREMHSRLHAILSDLVFESSGLDGFSDPDWHMQQIRDVLGPDLAGMTPVVHVPALVRIPVQGEYHTRQINLIGIDSKTYNQVSHFGEYLQHPANRDQLSFSLHESGYAPEKPDFPASGWRHRQMRIAFERALEEQYQLDRLRSDQHRDLPVPSGPSTLSVPAVEPTPAAPTPPTEAGERSATGDRGASESAAKAASAGLPTGNRREAMHAVSHDSAVGGPALAGPVPAAFAATDWPVADENATAPTGQERDDRTALTAIRKSENPARASSLDARDSGRPFERSLVEAIPRETDSAVQPVGLVDTGSGEERGVQQAVLQGSPETRRSAEPSDADPAQPGRTAPNPPPADPFVPADPYAVNDTQAKTFDPMQEQHTGIIMGIAICSLRARDAEGQVRDYYLCRPGDDVEVILPNAGINLKPVSSFFTVVDFYESKMSEYDSSFAFIPLESMQDLRGMTDPQTGISSVTSIQIKLRPGVDLDAARDKLRKRFPPEQHAYRIQTWRDMQGPLLAAVSLETTILNILLFLIIAVAGFGILATFFMIVVEKTRDIGILKALGAPSSGVMSIFLTYGISLGAVGSGVGMVIGLLFVHYINEIADGLEVITGQEVFDQTVYYFQSIPTEVSPWMVVWVVVGAVLIAVLASVLPALRAARLHPVEALRYE